MKKLTICIPTYNRANDVEYFLRTELEILLDYSINVSVFDSSENEDTEHVVEGLKETPLDLTYYKMDSNISSNEKFFLIYEKMCSEYEYVWITHDHTVFNKESLVYILENLKENVDFYFLKTQCSSFCSFETKDLNKFLYDSAWLLGKMGASIVNSKTFLNEVNWEFMKKKYLDEKCLNFSHIGFYFERASEVENFTAITMEFPREYFLDTHRNRKLSWDNEVIRICTECFGSVITKLPDTYTNKKDVLQTIDCYFLTKYKLIEYKKRGIYNIKSFMKYGKWIRKIFPNLYKAAFNIAVLPYSISLYINSKELVRGIKTAKSVGRKVCVYGAGKHAQECIEFARLLNISFDAVLVTSMGGNLNELDGVTVYEAERYLAEIKAYIVICVGLSGQSEILEYLEKLKKKKYDIEYQKF